MFGQLPESALKRITEVLWLDMLGRTSHRYQDVQKNTSDLWPLIE